MHGLRSVLTVTVLILAGGLTPVWSQGEVLVPGDPPLTQGLVNNYKEFFSYLLGVKLDADESKKFHALVVADWMGWDRTARDAFVKQLAEWDTVSKKGDKFAYRAKLLPQYLDRQGDPTKTSAAERWMMEGYRTVYKKIADESPIARMDRQPAPLAAMPLDNGFPDDPKHENVFPRPVVFTGPHLFSAISGTDSYVDRKTGELLYRTTHWWFFPTGRFYFQNVHCLGTERVKGTELNLFKTYYLDSKRVTKSWGRYTIDDLDRVQMETDEGEKIAMHLTYGRRQLNWKGTVYAAPSKKK
jgi:hypothetical protein